MTPDKKKYPCCANLYNFLNNFPDPNTMQSEMNASRFLASVPLRWVLKYEASEQGNCSGRQLYRR